MKDFLRFTLFVALAGTALHEYLKRRQLELRLAEVEHPKVQEVHPSTGSGTEVQEVQESSTDTFAAALSAIAPDITPGEMRLARCIRQGLDNKQIAETLAMSPDAIKKGRYRLRKKLPLTTLDSLETYLCHL